MKRNFLKRTMALTVAIAMTVSSVPANLVFAEEDVILDEAVEIVDEAAADTVVAETPVEVPAAVEVPADDITVEVVGEEEEGFVLDDQVNADAAAAISSDGTNQIAAIADTEQVTNVKLDPTSSYLLTWDSNSSYSRYEVSITDAAGTPYYLSDYKYNYYYDDADGTMKQGLANFTYGSSLRLADAAAYTMNAETGLYVKGALAFQPNNTYTIRVRGYRQSYENYTMVWTPGPWSSAISYTVPADTVTKLGVVQNVHWDPNNANVLCWDAVQYAKGYQLTITTADGLVFGRSGYSYLGSVYEPVKTDEDELKIDLSTLVLDGYTLAADGTYSSTEIKAFNVGTIYSISVRAVGGLEDGEPSAPVTYTPVLVTPNKVTDVKVNENGMLTWRGDNLDGESLYEVKVTDELGREYLAGVQVVNSVPVPTYYSTSSSSLYLNGTYSSQYGSGLIYWTIDPQSGNYVPAKEGTPENPQTVCAFKPGHTYTIQIQAVRKIALNSTTQTQRVESGWSDPVQFVYPADNKVPEKTGGLTFNGSSVSWNSVDFTGVTAPWGVTVPYGYEVRVTNPEETIEYLADGEKESLPTYYDTKGSSTSMAIAPGMLRGYTVANIANKVYTPEKDVTAFKRGQSYKIWVRAYDYKTDGTKQAPDWSDPIIITLPGLKEKVTGITVDDNLGMSWESDEHADGYQIDVWDAEGVHYYTDRTPTFNPATSIVEYTPKYATSYGTYCNLEDLDVFAFVKNGSNLELKKGADGGSIEAFVKGKTYYVAVRAYYNDGTMVYNTFSDPVAVTVPAPAKGINAPAAAVTGLELRTSASEKDNESALNGAVLQWNHVFDADYYDIRVTDAAGNEYFKSIDVEPNNKTDVNELKVHYRILTNSTFEDDYLQSVSLSALAGLKSYVSVPGSSVATVKDAAGNDLKTFVPGVVYNFQVRAVNVYEEWDATKNKDIKTEYPGEWSAPVSYTQAALAPITDLTYAAAESAKEGSYLFTYSAALSNSGVYYQIATDANFNAASLLDKGEWKQGNSSAYKLAVSKSSLKAGTTYYIRAINSISKPTDEDIAALTAVAPIPYTAFTTDIKTPKTITGLKLYETTENAFVFRYDAVLDPDDGNEVELQYNTGTGWVSNGNSTTLYFGNLPEGQVAVRAIAYVMQLNPATGENEKVYGAPSNEVAVTVTRETTAISALKLAEKTNEGYVFKFSGDLRKDELVEYWISQKSDFANSKKYTVVSRKNMSSADRWDGGVDSFTVYYTSLTPGTKYYVRARAYNPSNKVEVKQYSAFTGTVSFTAMMPQVNVLGTAIESKSITLRMDTPNNDEYLTGYEIQMKNGKKYEAVAKTTDDTYKVTGLKADTTYTFRIRPYYYNPTTGKTKNGSWVYYEATTWGGAMNLVAKAASETSVKLSWSKLSGASGYEIYRTVGNSYWTKEEDGYRNGFSKSKLIKTVKQTSKTKKTITYTDKGLTKNLRYTYVVRAYKEVDGQKFYIESGAGVGLGLSNFGILTKVKQSDGKLKVTWSRAYGADGYLIEKYDDVKDKWVTAAKLGASKTSKTFSKATGKTVHYRIRAYKGSTYSAAEPVDVDPFLAAPVKVKAVANTKDGSVKVTWKAVAGADYYRVYRTTSSSVWYDSTAKTYRYTNDEVPLTLYVADTTRVTGYREVTDTREMKETSFVDRPITYTVNGVENTLAAGPTPGVTYYYYVRAFKYGEEQIYNEVNTIADAEIMSADSKAASAMVSTVEVSKPTSLKVKAYKGKMAVTWKKVSNAVGYEVYRKTTAKGDEFELIGTVDKGTTAKYVDKTVKKGTKYIYRVRAIALTEAGLNKYSSYSKSSSKVTAK